MRGVLAALVLSLFLLAGCGSDTKAKNDYVGAVNRAQADFVAVVDDAQSRISGDATDADTAAQLAAIRTAAAKVVTQLRAVKPPSNVRTLHAQLIKEAQSLVTAFDTAATAYQSGDAQKILSAKVSLPKDVKDVNARLNTTIQALNSKLHD